MIHNHATAQDPDAKIAPAVTDHDDRSARVILSFGPEAIVMPTEDQAGFTVLILRAPAGPFSIPVLKAKVTFGPDLKPCIERLEAVLSDRPWPEIDRTIGPVVAPE